MTTPISCRLLVDPPGEGAWNMGVDESLLESFADGETCCLRFYQWEVPTLSLGFFQAYDDRRRHPPSLNCPIVRRPSGGGAIVHDRELTYCLVVPPNVALARQPRRLYETVHATLIDALADLGAARASICGHSGGFGPGDRPFLCFERRSPGDVVYGEAKIAGSAQRRRRGAVLQHGSVLLGRSVAAPELPGIADLATLLLTPAMLANAWKIRLEQGLALAFSHHELSAAQRRRARQLADEKYASADWTNGRRVTRE